MTDTTSTRPQMGDFVLLETLRWWRQIVDANPQDLAPRLDAAIERASIPQPAAGSTDEKPPVAGSELPDALAKLKIDILRAVFDWQAPFEIAKALYSTPTKGQCEAIVTTLGAMRDDYLVHYAAQNNTYKITERGRDYFNSRLATAQSQPAPVVAEMKK